MEMMGTVEKRFKVLDHARVGMCLIDMDYNVIFWNRCLERWTGIQKKDIIGTILMEYFPHLNEIQYKGRVNTILKGGPPMIFSSYLHKYIFPSTLLNGEKMIQNTTVTGVPVSDDDSGDQGYYALFAVEDVTELTRHIANLKSAEKTLRENEERLRSLFETMAEGVVLLTPDGEIIHANPAAESVLGLERYEDESRKYKTPKLEVLREDGSAMLEKKISDDGIVIGKHFVKNEIIGIKHPDDTLIWLNASTASVMDTTGKMTGVVVTFTDITYLKQTEEALKEARNQANAASKAKSEFLANMSHELRSPLNSMLILSEDLAKNNEKNLNSNQIKQAKIIHKGGAELLALINDILDLSKVEAGKMTVTFDDTSIDDITNVLNNTFRHQIGEKGLKFIININKDFPAILRTDQQRLNQIISNIISNAVKFTKEGNITVIFSIPENDADLSYSGLNHKDTVLISVIDTGIGIPSDKQKKIFEAFQQADNTTSREYGGTGLGLSISRELVRLLGGEIQLSSVEGDGTRFDIYLPAKMDEFKNTEKVSSRKKKSNKEDKQSNKKKKKKPVYEITENSIDDLSFKNKRILLVDDDMRNVYALSKVLEDKGMRVFKAGNGQKALDILDQESKIDLVLMDIMMPVMDGYEAMKQIRGQEQFSNLPILTLTAKAMKEDREKSLSAGANDYLSKPIDVNKLLVIMHTFLK